MAGPTLTQIRQRFMQLVGQSMTGTADSSSTASLLVDLGWPAASAGAAPSLWENAWLFVPSATLAADKVRFVDTYSPSRTSGTFYPDHDWSAASAISGKAYEVHTIFEPLTAVTRIINEGLKNCWIPVEFSFSPANATYTRHSLATAAPWVTDPRQILKVGVLSASSAGRNVDNPYFYGTGLRGEAVLDGTTTYLEMGQYQTTDTIYVRAMKQAYYACAGSGTPTVFTQSGLILEGDTVSDSVTLEWAAAAAMVQAWLEYSALMEANDRVRISRSEAAIIFGREDPGYGDQERSSFSRPGHFGPGSGRGTIPTASGRFA